MSYEMISISYEMIFLITIWIMFIGSFLLRSRDMARENKVTFREGLVLCFIDLLEGYWTKVIVPILQLLAPVLVIAILVLLAWLYINASRCEMPQACGPNVIDYEMYRR